MTISGAHAYLLVAVLEDSKLHLLIGNDALVDLEAIIDFRKGCLVSRAMKVAGLKLKETTGGHYHVEALPATGWNKKRDGVRSGLERHRRRRRGERPTQLLADGAAEEET